MLPKKDMLVCLMKYFFAVEDDTIFSCSDHEVV